MSDDERLAALFRTAASDADAPPPGFGHDDVVAASRRITARRRTTVVAAAAVVGLVGLGAAIVLPQQYGEGALTSAAAPMSAPEAAGGSAADSGEPGSGALERDNGAPLAPAPAPAAAPPGCADRHDAGLRALVVQVLPEVAGAPDAVTTDVCLPAAHRYLALDVDGGVLSVSYLPPGTIPDVATGTLSAPTVSGGTVLVSGPDIYAARLPAVRDFLAPRL